MTHTDDLFNRISATVSSISAIYIELSGITKTILTTAFDDKCMPEPIKAIAFAANYMPESDRYMPERALYIADAYNYMPKVHMYSAVDVKVTAESAKAIAETLNYIAETFLMVAEIRTMFV